MCGEGEGGWVRSAPRRACFVAFCRFLAAKTGGRQRRLLPAMHACIHFARRAHLAVEAPRPLEGGVEALGQVGGGHDDDALVRLHATHAYIQVGNGGSVTCACMYLPRYACRRAQTRHVGRKSCVKKHSWSSPSSLPPKFVRGGAGARAPTRTLLLRAAARTSSPASMHVACDMYGGALPPQSRPSPPAAG